MEYLHTSGHVSPDLFYSVFMIVDTATLLVLLFCSLSKKEIKCIDIVAGNLNTENTLLL